MNAISKVFPYNQVSVIFILSGWVMNLSFKTFGPLDATSPVAIEVMAFEQKKMLPEPATLGFSCAVECTTTIRMQSIETE